jgi:murein DD-endopeptidase MepM/ murein hydrolase activator NlpD
LANTNKRTHNQKEKPISTTHDKQIPQKIIISKTIVQYGIGILCLLLVIIVGVFVHYQQIVTNAVADRNELELLRTNGASQNTKIEQLATATADLQTDMERLNSLDAEIRRIVNNQDTTTTSRAGLMRPPIPYNGQGQSQVQLDINDIDHVVNELQVAVKVREESLVELKQELLSKQNSLATKPSIWPTEGEVTSRFGWRSSPTGEGSDYHPGIDIANSVGTPIVATADGVVTQSAWYGGYGQTVEIDHGNGIVTLYGHNSQLVVQSGQKVKKGQLIAYLGSTGYSTGPHVHYEVRVNGTAVNPTSFLN